MGNNNEAIVNSATATVLFWQITEVNPETISDIPDWTLGLMRSTPAKVRMTTEFDMDLMQLKWFAEYQTQFGFKKAPAGDFLIYDRGSVYSVTSEEFVQRYTIKQKTTPEVRPLPQPIEGE